LDALAATVTVHRFSITPASAVAKKSSRRSALSSANTSMRSTSSVAKPASRR
jgi:hypothetical protein